MHITFTVDVDDVDTDVATTIAVINTVNFCLTGQFRLGPQNRNFVKCLRSFCRPDTSSCQIMNIAISYAVRDCYLPGPDWCRPSGRPHNTWVHQICSDTDLSAPGTYLQGGPVR